jgi:hypothetical protein
VAIWLDGYARVDLGAAVAGGPYDDTTRPKLCWHTTEGRTITSARTAFRAYPPHLCYDPITDQAEQYIPLNRHSYAFRQNENDDEYIIQVEIVGFASQSHLWSDDTLRRLASRVVAPIRAAVGVPDLVVRTGFHGEGEGVVLARESSPIRIGSAELRSFAGHLGHQHLPGESHWDPGRIPIHKILTYSQESAVTSPAAVWTQSLNGTNAAGQPVTFTAQEWLTYCNLYAGQAATRAAQLINGQAAQNEVLADIAEAVGAGQEGPATITDDQLARVLVRPEVVQAYATALADEQDRRSRDADPATGPTT